MRNLALAVATVLVVAIASPAFAQPFADVPTDHWAFDAIAELAAKGIIEGFPDGTFKGDRGVSRYEVAIIVARILARIEAIKIPAPAPAAAPQVTRTDVQTIQRLVNEFRAELAALGVRTTAVEEELTALKARTSNVSVTGNARIRIYSYPSGSVSNLPTDFGTADMRNRVQFTGAVAPNVKLVARARFGTATLETPQGASFSSAAFDRSYLELPWGNLTWRIGQTDYTLGRGVGWSGYGLLADPSNAGINFGGPSPAGNNRRGYIDGVLTKGSFGGFSYELGGWHVIDALGFDIFTARVDAPNLLAGWALSFEGLYQHRNTAVPSPTTASGAGSGALSAASGTANTNDTGYGVNLTGNLFPGLTLGAAYATFSPAATASSNAYIGWAAWSLASMGMSDATVTGWYKNYGSATAGLAIPYWTGASTESGTYGNVAWNFNGWGLALDMKLGGAWSGTFEYESGNQTVTPALAVTEYNVQLVYAVANNTNVNFGWWKATLGPVDGSNDNYYKIEITTSY